MTRYIAKRFLLMIPTLLGVAVLVFVLLRVLPGDVVEMRFASGQNQFVDQKMLDAERAKLGLDKPIWQQFRDYLTGLLRLDLGRSMWTGSPITEEIKLRFALSLQLALMATLVATVLAIPLGILAALRQDTWVDYAVRVFSIAGLAMPSFWLGIVLILVFAVSLDVLPSAGVTSADSDTLADRLAHLVLPTVALATTILPTVVRFTRSSTIEVLHEDYVRTATSKGLRPRTVMTRHALRNALIPVVSAIGALVPRLIGGTVVTEAVFGWPGMGRLALEAAQGRDYPLVTGLTVVVAAIAVLASLLVDLAYTRIDPRVRIG